jgi:hypothetical protein
MNHLAISGYNPLTRNTNLGWPKAQTKSQLSPLSFSPKSTPKMKEHSHHQSKEMTEIQPLLLYIGPPENDRSPPTLGVTSQALTGSF